MTQPEKPTELIYLSSSSVYPALAALGLAAVVVGLFAWWPYAVAGALIALFAIAKWLAGNRAEIARMPRSQRTESAPIPLSGRE